ncbi:sulfate adenylyltransferase [Vibrio sp. RE86]|uniref:transglutaminase-like cysteine peptidase n=1 Tax=Vibrio sp. RE86 TaxID=2607605 RepID=UPI0014933F09|nr:transglutaminase-like cysteine peptidase [Vibrio sp. RE86]NOH79903.1 sulfate adenylyltransferase [Vibrio sp. RE86]
MESPRAQQRISALRYFALVSSICLAFLFSPSPLASVAFNVKEIPDLVSKIKMLYGDSAYRRANDWIELVDTSRNQDLNTQINLVNDFFNEMTFIDDAKLWGKDDYWASLAEFIGAGGGDCEDFTLAKFYTLVFLGVDPNQLQMTYVNAIEYQEAHMVLTYQETPNNEPLILDNIEKRVLPASQRTDLEPIYAFSVEEIWLTKQLGQGQLIGKATKIKPWVRVMESTRALKMATPVLNLDKAPIQ